MDTSSITSHRNAHCKNGLSPSKSIIQNLKKSIFSNKNSTDFIKKWNSKDPDGVLTKIKKNQLSQSKSKQISIENCLLLSQRKRKWSPNKIKIEEVKSMVARKGYS
jgi:hypothetical protein